MPRNSRLGYPVSGPRFEPGLATRPPCLMIKGIGTICVGLCPGRGGGHGKAREIAVTCVPGCRVIRGKAAREWSVHSADRQDPCTWIRRGDTQERIANGGLFTGYFLFILPCKWNTCKTIQAILIKLGMVDIHPILSSHSIWCSV
jgi:hypothetical protein